MPYERWATDLARWNTQATQVLALRAVDIDTAAAPASVPNLALDVDYSPIEPAGSPVTHQLRHSDIGKPVTGSTATRYNSFLAVSAKYPTAPSGEKQMALGIVTQAYRRQS